MKTYFIKYNKNNYWKTKHEKHRKCKFKVFTIKFSTPKLHLNAYDHRKCNAGT